MFLLSLALGQKVLQSYMLYLKILCGTDRTLYYSAKWTVWANLILIW